MQASFSLREKLGGWDGRLAAKNMEKRKERLHEGNKNDRIITKMKEKSKKRRSVGLLIYGIDYGCE